MHRPHCSRIFTLTLALSGAALLGACDRKPSTSPNPSTSSAGSTAVTRTTTTPDSYPAGIIPANSGAAVVAGGPSSNKTDANKGPSDGATAIGGVTGNAGTGAGSPPKGGPLAPTAGDGAPPKP